MARLCRQLIDADLADLAEWGSGCFEPGERPINRDLLDNS